VDGGCAGGRFGVTGLDRGEDCFVLGDRAFLAARDTSRRVTDQKEHAAEVVEKLRHAAVAAGSRLDVGEGGDAVEEALEVARTGRLLALADGCLESRNDLRRSGERELPGDLRLEQPAQLEDLADVLLGRLEHACTAIRLDLDEAVSLEPDERLAHGSLRDPELLGYACLDELLARLELTGDDLVAETLVHAPLELRREDLLTNSPRHRGHASYIDRSPELS
jgi:hypothetical protein